MVGPLVEGSVSLSSTSKGLVLTRENYALVVVARKQEHPQCLLENGLVSVFHRKALTLSVFDMVATPAR